MDEPTAALGVRETAAVVDVIRRINERGLAIDPISHIFPRCSSSRTGSWC